MTDENDARAKMGEAQFQKDIAEIVSLGHLEMGTAPFDDASQTVAEKLGARTNEVMSLAAQFDAPHRLVAKLASDPATLERLAKLPPARIVTELARIEARTAPAGHVETRAAPAWRGPEMRGQVSDADWKRTYGSNLTEDLFDRVWREKMRQRAERKGR